MATEYEYKPRIEITPDDEMESDIEALVLGLMLVSTQCRAGSDSSDGIRRARTHLIRVYSIALRARYKEVIEYASRLGLDISKEDVYKCPIAVSMMIEDAEIERRRR